jgi:hypothetical protein
LEPANVNICKTRMTSTEDENELPEL